MSADAVGSHDNVEFHCLGHTSATLRDAPSKGGSLDGAMVIQELRLGVL